MRVRSRSLLWIGLVLASALALGSCGKRETGPAMWHITDADSDIYLFGTFHLLSAKLDWQKPAMVAAFDKSSILIMEADVTGAAPGDVVKLIQRYGLAPPDRPLRSRLN
ncbi:MAG TPA: TraB/GumN family protein, partial [Alphaproteobacteria bacterium]|nr:TraB/GumN family protein [Alphaproteobacteria bacterium]